METFKNADYVAAGIDREFVHDNESSSKKGVLCGLHFQKNHTQGKLVRVTQGEVFGVAVVVIPGSETFWAVGRSNSFFREEEYVLYS